MPRFRYTAKTAGGEEITAFLEAPNAREVRKQLRQQGLTPVAIQQVMLPGAAPKQKKPIIAIGRITGKDLAIFARQFATMINAGVSLVRCLNVLEQQTGNYKLKEVIRGITAEVESGSTLSGALQKRPKVFSNLFVGLVRAGEVGGVLDESLERIATFLEKDQELRRKVKSSMTYPVLVMIAAVGIVTFLSTYIVPKFIKLFLDLGMKEEDFPAPTRFLMKASDFLKSQWYVALGIVIGLWVFIGWYKRTTMGKFHYDWVKLRLPVFGKLSHKIALARFSRTLGTLLGSGVPILNAMETVAEALDNEPIGRAVMQARASIREGHDIGTPLAESGYFPPMVVQMISIGEETGALDQMLHKVADFYESEVEAALESLTAALEPVMIVFLGFVVGFIVISMFLPLVKIISELSGGGGGGAGAGAGE